MVVKEMENSTLSEKYRKNFFKFAKNSVSNLKPEDFLRRNEVISTECLELLKQVYDFAKEEEGSSQEISSFKLNPLKSATKKKRGKKNTLSKSEEPLKDLVIGGFDETQIWEEIQLQNGLLYENLVSSVSGLISRHKSLVGDDEEEEEELGQGEGVDEESDDGEEMDEEGLGEEEDEEEDDDMRQSNSLERSLRRIAAGEGDPEDEDQKKEELDKPKQSSAFELRKKKIESNIERIENEALEAKPWQLAGEVTADKRPENSLLEEHLLFDHLIRHAPEVTPETTQKLEDLIKQRIKDNCFDDVERKYKIEDVSEYKKRVVLDAEKSKLSLAQLYEQEYLNKKKVEELGEEKEEEVPKEHQIIQEDMKRLFAKLDALSNFHYTPKAPQAQVKVITNVSSIIREEIAPTSVSDAALLAPQEIQESAKGAIKAKAERSDTDRKRERRLKKKTQKMKKIHKEEKAKLKGLGAKSVKTIDELKKSKKSKSSNSSSTPGFMKELRTSKAFFSKLEEQAKSQIKEKLKSKKKVQSKDLDAKKFKL